MRSIEKKISNIERFSLDDLGIDMLQVIRDEIVQKQKDLESDLDKIHQSVNLLSVENVENAADCLPGNFTSPLRKVLIKYRDLDQIKRKYGRYNDELKMIDQLIHRKTLNHKLVSVLGSQWMIYLKEIIITVLIILVLGAMFYEFTRSDITPDLALKLFLFDTGCCIVFLINFFFELWLSDSKKWYWKNHWIDFITSIPIPDAKILRAGRILRLARLLRLMRLLRFLRVILLLVRGMESFKELFDIRLMKKTLAYTFILMLIGSAAIIYFEQRPESISNYLEGIWWSFTTIVTGGFGDIHNPVSMGGMLVTVILVIAGMVLIGVFIATLSSILASDVDDDVRFLREHMDARFSEIEATIAEKLNDK
tara:strand:- start:4016 stop:5113 length:1098 start_codon:yes stop_codon:yes gene_type:complete